MTLSISKLADGMDDWQEANATENALARHILPFVSPLGHIAQIDGCHLCLGKQALF